MLLIPPHEIVGKTCGVGVLGVTVRIEDSVLLFADWYGDDTAEEVAHARESSRHDERMFASRYRRSGVGVEQMAAGG